MAGHRGLELPAAQPTPTSSTNARPQALRRIRQQGTAGQEEDQAQHDERTGEGTGPGIRQGAPRGGRRRLPRRSAVPSTTTVTAIESPWTLQ